MATSSNLDISAAGGRATSVGLMPNSVFLPERFANIGFCRVGSGGTTSRRSAWNQRHDSRLDKRSARIRVIRGPFSFVRGFLFLVAVGVGCFVDRLCSVPSIQESLP